jgi:hypothetical protein
MAVDAWIEEPLGECDRAASLSGQGLEMKESDSAEIVPIKSCRIEGALQLQLYVERPKPA